MQIYRQLARNSVVIIVSPEKIKNAGLMSPSSGIALIVIVMKDTHAMWERIPYMDYKGVGVDWFQKIIYKYFSLLMMKFSIQNTNFVSKNIREK